MLIEKVKKTIEKYGLLCKGDKVLVGVSGGPDSLTLLFVLNAIKKELKLKLHIAHLDHRLREKSREDAVFVKRIAQKLDLPVTVSTVDIRRRASKGGSVEEIARNSRLGFFLRLAKRIKADKVALAHSFDDQAETVLMRIIRGSGLYGLSAIRPKRKINGTSIIRPLLEISRKEIERYLKTLRIKPRKDPSNRENLFLRNKIRNNLLPLLEKEYNSGIKEVLCNLAESAAIDYDYLHAQAKKTLPKRKQGIRLEKLKKLHPSIQRLALRLSIDKIKGNMRKIDFRHIRELEDLILNRPAGSVVDLPQGISVKKNKSYLSIYKR